jgi:uncharacterized protein (TIGR02246 family)
MPAQTPEQLHDLFREAFNAQDLDALMALYEPDAVLVAQPGQVAAGTEQIREALAGFLALNGPISMTHLGGVHRDDLAILYGRWTVEGTGPDGQPVTVGGVTSDVMRRGADGAWRFAVDNPFADATINAG